MYGDSAVLSFTGDGAMLPSMGLGAVIFSTHAAPRLLLLLCQLYVREFGCLLPSLSSDAVFDKSSDVGFMCDLNDNIVAPWPSSSSSLLPSSCNRTTKLPSLPTATSSQN
ncbi:hypothetical protein HN51_035924 [Arachis hypogaea]